MMRALKDCEYEVGFYVSQGTIGWEAQTNSDNGIDMGVLDSGLLFKADGSSISTMAAATNWKRFAKINGIKKWKFGPLVRLETHINQEREMKSERMGNPKGELK